MARKKVLDLNCEKTVVFEKAGQTVSGYYIGSRSFKGDYGISQLHVLQAEDGSVGIYGSAKLDSSLLSVPKGAMTFITYQGKVKLSGGRTMKKFDVEYDDEDTVEVAAAPTFAPAAEPTYEEAVDADDELMEADSEDLELDEIKNLASRPKDTNVNSDTANRLNSLLQKAKR